MLLKYGSNGNTTATTNDAPMSHFIACRSSIEPLSASGTLRPGRSGTAAPSTAKARPIARPRTKIAKRITPNTANSAVPALLVSAATTW